MASMESSQAAEIRSALERLNSFTERLLAENARLRQALARSHAGGGPPPDGEAEERIRELERRLADARQEAASLSRGGASPTEESERSAALERELADVKQRLDEVEDQNNNLANLYVASYQLHSTLDFKEVIAVVMEIVINLIGAERFCLMLLDGKTQELAVIAAEGMDRTPSARIKLGDGRIGGVAQTGETYYRAEDEDGETDFLHPLAAIPLKIKDHVIGVIAVYGLFPQKQGFSTVDYDLFNLLAGHAATAIFSAKLYSESERKLSTIQSFLDLLTTG